MYHSLPLPKENENCMRGKKTLRNIYMGLRMAIIVHLTVVFAFFPFQSASLLSGIKVKLLNKLSVSFFVHTPQLVNFTDSREI